jgi:hypothetical protein
MDFWCLLLHTQESFWNYILQPFIMSLYALCLSSVSRILFKHPITIYRVLALVKACMLYNLPLLISHFTHNFA